MSEKVLDDIDAQEDLVRQRKAKLGEQRSNLSSQKSSARSFERGRTFYERAMAFFPAKKDGGFLEMSMSRSRKAKTARSSASLLGAYVDLGKQARRKRSETKNVFRLVENMIKE